MKSYLQKTQEIIWKDSSPTKTRRKLHEYLGISFELSHSEKVNMTMFNYIDDILNLAMDDTESGAIIPVENHVFEVHKDA